MLSLLLLGCWHPTPPSPPPQRVEACEVMLYDCQDDWAYTLRVEHGRITGVWEGVVDARLRGSKDSYVATESELNWGWPLSFSFEAPGRPEDRQTWTFVTDTAATKASFGEEDGTAWLVQGTERRHAHLTPGCGPCLKAFQVEALGRDPEGLSAEACDSAR